MEEIVRKSPVREIDIQHLREARILLKMVPVKEKIKKKCYPEERYRGSLVSPLSPTFAAQELRKCLLRHNWDRAASLLILLLDESSAFLKKVLVKSCLLTLMYHPNSTQQLREEFVRLCCGIIDDNELLKSLKRFPNRTLRVRKSKTVRKKSVT